MSAAWVKANPEKMRVHRRVWRVKNPKVVRKLAIEYEKRNPEKRRAHVAICNAVRRGTIIKPTICEDCGEGSRRIEAHHADYSKLLEVNWLCQPCHIKTHKTMVV
jgi:hypothetical protein